MQPSTIVRFVTRLAMLCVALGAAAGRVDAAPLALVTDVVGNARQGGEPLRILGEVDAGRELALEEGTTVVVFYLADGSEWTLHGPGRYRLAPKAPETLAGAPAQRRPGPPAYRDMRLRADRLQQGGLVMRSATLDEPMALVAPAKGEAVLDSDVRFRWRPLEGSASYQFELVDQAGQKLLAAETTDNELDVPLAIALKPGQTYYWAVRGRASGGAQPVYRVAEFRVLDAAARRRVEAARPKDEAPFSERVLFVALLEDVGALTEAARQRLKLAAERPVGWAPSK